MPHYRPEEVFLGGFSPNDGTIAFYSRIKAIVNPNDVVLDLGAGRAAWFEDDACAYRRLVRDLKGHVREVIAADIDEAVLLNRASNRNIVVEGRIPLPDASVDLIIADYVLEHIENPEFFASEISRLLKPSGIFCARTPHKYNYVAIGARLFSKRSHKNFLNMLQPSRKNEDIFPTTYKLNTIKDILRYFPGFKNYSYLFRNEPSYYFGNAYIFKLMNFIHSFLPVRNVGNIFIFLTK